jgi:hypothetical protein
MLMPSLLGLPDPTMATPGWGGVLRFADETRVGISGGDPLRGF